MNIGLGNLIELKRHLLPASHVAGAAYDAPVIAVGKGVAAAFERRCNRKFSRVVGDLMTLPGDREMVYVSRYPLEVVSKVELQSNATTGFVEVVEAVSNFNAASGLVYFGSQMGNWSDVIRVTYTGGYWFDIDELGETAMPEGATAVPDDLKLAWYLQCRRVWESLDKQGARLAAIGSAGAGSLMDLSLVPEVSEILLRYVRYAS